jgi:hypothetical protein
VPQAEARFYHFQTVAYGVALGANSAGIRGNAADVEAALVACFAVDCGFRLNHPEHAQIGPLLGSSETFPN